jgi:hypothetical protein
LDYPRFGWYCLAFLLFLWKNRQNINMKDIFNQFVNNFMDDTKRNDEIFKTYIFQGLTESQY